MSESVGGDARVRSAWGALDERRLMAVTGRLEGLSPSVGQEAGQQVAVRRSSGAAYQLPA